MNPNVPSSASKVDQSGWNWKPQPVKNWPREFKDLTSDVVALWTGSKEIGTKRLHGIGTFKQVDIGPIVASVQTVLGSIGFIACTACPFDISVALSGLVSWPEPFDNFDEAAARAVKLHDQVRRAFE